MPKINRRTATMIALAGPALIGLAACSSSSSGHGTIAAAVNGSSTTSATGSAGTGSAPASGAGSAAASATSTDAAGLATALQHGLAEVTSAHISMNIAVSGSQISVVGDEKISGSTLQAMDIKETIPSVGDLEILLADGKLYGKLPAGMVPGLTSAKPWVAISATSSNSALQQLASTLQSSLDSASLNSVAAFGAAAQSVKVVGQDTVDGAPATHYSLVVDVTKLPDVGGSAQALTQAGITTLPYDMWIDGQGRPVKFQEALSVQGTSTTTTGTISNYNQPVTIAAPPADQIAPS